MDSNENTPAQSGVYQKEIYSPEKFKRGTNEINKTNKKIGDNLCKSTKEEYVKRDLKNDVQEIERSKKDIMSFDLEYKQSSGFYIENQFDSSNGTVNFNGKILHSTELRIKKNINNEKNNELAVVTVNERINLYLNDVDQSIRSNKNTPEKDTVCVDSNCLEVKSDKEVKIEPIEDFPINSESIQEYYFNKIRDVVEKIYLQDEKELAIRYILEDKRNHVIMNKIGEKHTFSGNYKSFSYFRLKFFCSVILSFLSTFSGFVLLLYNKEILARDYSPHDAKLFNLGLVASLCIATVLSYFSLGYC